AVRRHRARHLRLPDRLPYRPDGHRARRARHEFRDRRQRPAGPGQGGELDPRRLLPEPGQPRRLRALDPRRHRCRDESAPGLGRWHLRVTPPLRVVRRARPNGVAGLPVRVCDVRGGTAAARRGDRRGTGERRPATPPPSLAIWNGNNENLWGYEIWGWTDELGDKTWGRGYYLDVLPRIVAELDPTRPYSPGSPWSFDPDVPSNE